MAKFTAKVHSGPSILKEKLLPLISHILLAVINIYCFLIYYTDITGKNLQDLGYVAYLTMTLHGVFGLTKFFNEDTFIDLRMLLDYAHVVLPHPFITTALWQKLDVAEREVCLLHCFLGLGAFLFYVIMEEKRQDLTDLALIVSILSTILVGIANLNYFAVASSVLLAVIHFKFKRADRSDECMGRPPVMHGVIHNFGLCIYSVLTLAAFEPKNFIPELS